MAGALDIELSAAEPPQPRVAHRWIIALSVMLGTILELLDSSIINVALPHMQGSFSASVDEVTWVVTSYLVANGVMIPLTGWISARFGRKRYFLLSVSGFVLASAACGAARSLNQMVLFRLIQGLAGAAMQPCSQAILMETFPPQEQAMAMAFWGLGMMVAPVAGPTVGGWITDNWSWRWNFYINVPIGALAFLMVSNFLHDPPYLRKIREQRARVDYAGIVLVTLGLGAMQMVLDRGQRADWFASNWVTFATLLAIVCFVFLIWQELTFPDPILDLRIFLKPTFSLALAVGVIMMGITISANLLNPVFLQEFMGYTAWRAGLALAPKAVGAALVMLLVGQLSRWRIDVKPLMVLGLVIQCIGLWDMSNWNLQVDMYQITKSTVLLSAGFAMIFPALSAATLQCVERERMGYAASLYSMIRNVGASVGISVTSAMLVSYQQLHQSYLTEHFSVFEAWRLGITPQRMPGSPRFQSLASQMAGHKSGLAMIYSEVQLHAAMLALNDIYFSLLLITLTIVPALTFIWMWQDTKMVRPQAQGAEPAFLE
jgi:DHA2 family multidrug resistance protein